MRVAILDDYQQISLASADWSAVRSLGRIDVFAEHISRTEALVSALEPYDVIVAMRERTPFDAATLGQLPRLIGWGRARWRPGRRAWRRP